MSRSPPFCFMTMLAILLQILLPAVPPPVADDTVRVVFIGDVMMHKEQLGRDHSVFLSDIAPLLEEADMAVANAEFTLAGKPYTGYPAFSAPDSYVNSILEAGVDVLLTANNHILDKGPAGLKRTLGRYDGIPYAGSGADRVSFEKNNPLIVLCKGVKIALVNFTYGTNMEPECQYPRVAVMDEYEVAAQFERAKKANPDLIIALPHWGEEYKLRHNGSQEQWASKLVALGADAVIGAHPHVVQDTCFLSGVPVIYSMGNAVSNMSAKNTRLELAVELPVLRNRISGECRPGRPVLHFLWCTLPGKLTDNYMTVEVEKYRDKRYLWKDPEDYDNMMRTLERVRKATGIE